MLLRGRTLRTGATAPLAAIALTILLTFVGAPLPGTTATSRAATAASSPWRFTTPFNQGRTSASSVRIGNRVYLVGGYSYDEATEKLSIYNDVQWATIRPEGGVSGGWHETTPFNVPRLGQSAVRYGDYIYVIGGGNGIESYYNTVEYAKVGADGNITAAGWHTTSALNLPRAALSTNVTTIDGRPYLYAIGGAGNNAKGETIHFASVEYAPVHADGMLGPWTVSANEFVKPRSSMTTAIVGGCLYVVGGFGEAFTEILADVQYSCINPNGSVGRWTTSPNSMHDARYGAEMVVVPGSDNAGQAAEGAEQEAEEGSGAGPARFIVIGGDAGEGTYLKEIEETTVNRRSGNTPWTVAPESSFLPQAQWGQTGVLFRGNVYVLGGLLRDQEYLNQVIYAPVSTLFP
jgi:hypothetical protein